MCGMFNFFCERNGNEKHRKYYKMKLLSEIDIKIIIKTIRMKTENGNECINDTRGRNY